MYFTGMLGVRIQKIGDFVEFNKNGEIRRIYGTDEAHAAKIYQAALDARQAILDEVNGQIEQELKFLLDTEMPVEHRLDDQSYRVNSLLADQQTLV